MDCADYSTSASARGSATCNDDIDALHCNAHLMIHTVLQPHLLHSTTLFYPQNFLDSQATPQLSYLQSGRTPSDDFYANGLNLRCNSARNNQNLMVRDAYTDIDHNFIKVCIKQTTSLNSKFIKTRKDNSATANMRQIQIASIWCCTNC